MFKKNYLICKVNDFKINDMNYNCQTINGVPLLYSDLRDKLASNRPTFIPLQMSFLEYLTLKKIFINHTVLINVLNTLNIVKLTDITNYAYN